MGSMTTPTLGPGHTRDDLDRVPDDGNRYELIEGEIVMSPSPRTRHQVIAANLFTLLRAACPPELMVLFAPFDVALEERSVVVPDLVVFDPVLADEHGLEAAPRLVVEILSPTTRGRDLVRKKRLYERSGVASYWIVDPDDEVSLTAWELRHGEYQAVASIAGPESWTASAPFPVTVSAAHLASM